jgi:hypothetical protein
MVRGVIAIGAATATLAKPIASINPPTSAPSKPARLNGPNLVLKTVPPLFQTTGNGHAARAWPVVPLWNDYIPIPDVRHVM